MIKIKVLKKKEQFIGGAGDYKPDSDFDPLLLKKGKEKEMHDHGLSAKQAKEIAKDELVSNPKDYTKELEDIPESIKKYLSLQEEEKKAAVMVGELLKQLESHKDKVWVFFDTETMGLDPHERQLIEVAAIAIKPDFVNGNAHTISTFHKKVDLTPETQELLKQPHVPKRPNDKSPAELLQMTQYHTTKAPIGDEQSVLKEFIEYIQDLEKQGKTILVAHNAQFDRKFISVRSEKYGLEKLNTKTIDTLDLVYEFFYPLLIVADKEDLLSKMKSAKGAASFTLGNLTNALNINNKNWHSALADVTALIDVTQQIIKRLQQNKDLDVRAGYEKSLMQLRNRKKFLKKKK